MFCPETLALINAERIRLAEMGLPERNALFNILNPPISKSEQKRRDYVTAERLHTYNNLDEVA